MKKYEGLFIFNSTGEEELKTAIDRVSQTISDAEGKIETVQKMEKRQFARVSDKKHTAGFYVNIIFEIAPGALKPLQEKFAKDEEIYRVLFTAAPAPKPVAANP